MPKGEREHGNGSGGGGGGGGDSANVKITKIMSMNELKIANDR